MVRIDSDKLSLVAYVKNPNTNERWAEYSSEKIPINILDNVTEEVMEVVASGSQFSYS
jgi:hypothetical protein